MKKKANRLDAIKMIISSKDVSSQEELLQALSKEGFELTQATLSRDLKQLKVAKAANMNGKYVYVLPNNIMYKRSNDQSASEMLMTSGFVSLQFSGNIAVIRRNLFFSPIYFLQIYKLTGWNFSAHITLLYVLYYF